MINHIQVVVLYDVWFSMLIVLFRRGYNVRQVRRLQWYSPVQKYWLSVNNISFKKI